MTLKLKYRVRPYSKGGATIQRTDNSHGPKKYRKRGRPHIRGRRRIPSRWAD